MNRDEWNAYAESVPLTVDQRGAILGHCDRLGLVDRSERLATLAALLGLGELESTADLTLGQAGRLVGILERTRDRAELLAADDDEHQDDEHARAPVTLAEVLAPLMDAISIAFPHLKHGSRLSKAGNFPDFARDEGALSACINGIRIAEFLACVKADFSRLRVMNTNDGSRAGELPYWVTSTGPALPGWVSA